MKQIGKAKIAMTEPNQDRLYQDLARKIFTDLAEGRFNVGDRLPAERELAAEYGVSRPTVREAIIALEVQGFVEVKIGSGAYVRRLPGKEAPSGFNVSAFEVTEARLLFESEAVALAATMITDAEIEELEALVRKIADANLGDKENDAADREFHLVIARATRNKAIAYTVEEMWRLRATSPESALLLNKAWSANVRPVVEEHAAIVAALKTRDPSKARAAMRAHLSAALEHLLFTTEEQAVEQARRAAAATRARYLRSRSV